MGIYDEQWVRILPGGTHRPMSVWWTIHNLLCRKVLRSDSPIEMGARMIAGRPAELSVLRAALIGLQPVWQDNCSCAAGNPHMSSEPAYVENRYKI